MEWVKFLVCLFLGIFGVHKFMEKKIGMGILYLCTAGLFGFGWMYDCIKYLILAIKHNPTQSEEGKIAAVTPSTKKWTIPLIVVVLIFCIGIFTSAQNGDSNDNSSSISTEDALVKAANKATQPADEDATETANLDILFLDVISDEVLCEQFIYACGEIGMDVNRVRNIEQVDDWVGGPRYSFVYDGIAFRLYCNMDSTVNSIRIGNDTNIYLQGYEPYQVDDYIPNPSVTSELQVQTEKNVKSQLNYPETADFPWLDWAFGRERDLYTVSSHVTAKNSFGVEDKLNFSITYQVTGSSAKIVYFLLDGNELVNKMDSISIPERKEVETVINDADFEENTIILVDGQLGNYGEIVTIDGDEYINYYIPYGSYTIENNVNWCKIYVSKDKYYKNSDGYTENEIVTTIEFSEFGETATITVNEGEHIELTINAKVKLTPISE